LKTAQNTTTTTTNIGLRRLSQFTTWGQQLALFQNVLKIHFRLSLTVQQQS